MSCLPFRSQETLYAQYAGHWYLNEPQRGCAYRSMTYAPPLVDSLLMRAAESAGVRDAAFGSAQSRGEADFLLWVRLPALLSVAAPTASPAATAAAAK